MECLEEKEAKDEIGMEDENEEEEEERREKEQSREEIIGGIHLRMGRCRQVLVQGRCNW